MLIYANLPRIVKKRRKLYSRKEALEILYASAGIQEEK